MSDRYERFTGWAWKNFWQFYLPAYMTKYSFDAVGSCGGSAEGEFILNFDECTDLVLYGHSETEEPDFVGEDGEYDDCISWG